MAEYIEREAAVELLSQPITMSLCLSLDECHHKIAQRRIDLDLIKSIPAADVRPVVLCRDCKFNCGAKTWIDHEITADCTNGHGYPPLDWFCADGVKREES